MKIQKALILFLILFLYALAQFGTLWLSGVFFILVTFYSLFFYINQIQKKTSRIVFIIIFHLLFLLITIPILRGLIVDVFIVDGVSMTNTLLPNDMVLVNKLSYGSKFANLRLKGTGEIGKDDIVLYQNPNGEPAYFIKRIIAIAGDTISFKYGEIFVNKQVVLHPETGKKKYLILAENKYKLHREMDTLMIEGSIENATDYRGGMYMNLDRSEKLKVERSKYVKSIEPVIDSASYIAEEFLNLYCNGDNYFPFIVPKKGMKLILSYCSYKLYKKTIEMFENKNITLHESEFYVDGKKSDSYIFQLDYCFLKGDNCDKSTDSRHFGVVPVRNILGEAQPTKNLCKFFR